MKFIHRFFWLMPFLCCVIGYYSISWFVGIEIVQAPQLVGSRLTDVVASLAPYHLHLAILGEVEDATLPEGMVLSQRPEAGQKIKAYQSMGVVVSRKPYPILAPAVVGRMVEEISSDLDRKGIRLKIHHIEHIQPIGTCVAQVPSAGIALDEKRMQVYVSAGASALRIMPDLKGKSLCEVTAFVDPYGAKLAVSSALQGHMNTCNHCRITAQKPLAGSCIDMRHMPLIQVHVIHDAID